MISYYDQYHWHHPCHYYYYCHFHGHCQCQCQCHRHIIIIIIISITIKIKFLFLFILVFIHTQFTFSHQIVSFRHIQPSRATPSSWRYSHVTSHNETLDTRAHYRKKQRNRHIIPFSCQRCMLWIASKTAPSSRWHLPNIVGSNRKCFNILFTVQLTVYQLISRKRLVRHFGPRGLGSSPGRMTF